MKGRIAAASLLLLLACCSRDVVQDEFPGVYRFDFGEGTEVIEVKSDGTYSNSLYTGKTLDWEDAGTWSVDNKMESVGITFNRFRFGVPDRSHVQGYWFVIPERSILGHKRLCFDLDLGRCFEAH